MENRSHALVAGAFVILMGVATALAVWYFSGKRDSDFYLLETHRNVTGLNVQAQVRYRGIRAGKVESIEQDAADPRIILVKISLDPRFRLTRASTARLGHQGITGLAYVEIEDDGSSAEQLPIDDANPTRLPLKPGLVETLTDKAGDVVAQVSELTLRLNRLLDDKNAASLARTLDNVANASDSLKEVPQILAAMRALLSDENLKRINATLSHVEKAAGEAAPLATEARQLLATMTAASQRLERLLGENRNDVSIETLVKQLSANSRQLNRLLENLQERPQSLLVGPGAQRPGPGEAGFAVPQPSEK
jgi:phospholipid/cholesterol/gamma-HCH transport system substrate-binding protein